MTRILPEWASHSRTWIAWPWDDQEWAAQLPAAQKTMLTLAERLVDAGESVTALVHPTSETPSFAEAVETLSVSYGDAWLRDTLPLFGNLDGTTVAIGGNFNGWAGKYVMEGDSTLAAKIAEQVAAAYRPADFVFEGGALEFDGAGAVMSTRNCLLAPGRNPTLSASELRGLLRETFAVEDIYLFDATLSNDHTDGHIDNLVRFVAPGKVAYVGPTDISSPHYEALSALRKQLNDTPFECVELPDVGLYHDGVGRIAPASYANFYIANRAVIVPTYGVQQDKQALAVLQDCFPTRDIVGIDAAPLLVGGGSIHCLTMQQAKVPHD